MNWKRLAVIGGFLGLIAFSASLLSRVTPFEVQTLLSSSHPVRQQYESYLKKFDDGRAVYLLVRSDPGEGRPWPQGQMRKISNEIGAHLDLHPAVSRVIAPHNAKYFTNSGGFGLESFFSGGEITEEGKKILDSELWRRTLFADDFRSFLVQIEISESLKRSDEAPFFRELAQFTKSLEARNPGVEIHALGSKVASAAFLEEMGFNLKVITPLLLLLIGIFMWILYRSWQIIFWNFFVMIGCYLITLIVIVIMEGGLGPYSNFALMFSFIVATTDLVQYFCRYQALPGTVEERMREAWKNAYVPCLLTSLCTAAGFIALVFHATLVPIRYFGFYCAFACILEWVVIFYVLPPVMRLFGFSAPRRVTRLERPLRWYVEFVRKRAAGIVAVSVVLVALGAAASFKLKVDDNFYTKFKENHALSQAVDAFSRYFQFVGSVDVILKPTKGGVFDEENLLAIREFESQVSTWPEVARLTSVRQVSDELSRLLSSVPKSEREGRQKSLLSLLDNYGALRDLYYSPTQESRTVVFLQSLSTDDLDNALGKIEKLKADFAGRIDVQVSGFASIRSYINSRVIQDLLESFLLSFFLTYLCFVYLYKNAVWAFLALLPNALPLLVISGTMGLLGVPVDGNLAVMICVAFGISGDNTVQLTYVLKQNRRAAPGYVEGLALAIREVGMPILATSGVFLFCLPVFLLGHLKLFNHMAIYLSLAFAMAFFADLFAFPAFHVLFRKKV